jgi:hypothetical protein
MDEKVHYPTLVQILELARVFGQAVFSFYILEKVE